MLKNLLMPLICFNKNKHFTKKYQNKRKRSNFTSLKKTHWIHRWHGYTSWRRSRIHILLLLRKIQIWIWWLSLNKSSDTNVKEKSLTEFHNLKIRPPSQVVFHFSWKRAKRCEYISLERTNVCKVSASPSPQVREALCNKVLIKQRKWPIQFFEKSRKHIFESLVISSGKFSQ